MINNSKNKDNKKKLPYFRIIILSLSFIILGFILNIYINNNKIHLTSTYTSNLNNFYTKFNNCQFEEAKNILKTNYSSNRKKQNKLSNDLNSYFTGVVDKVCSYIKKGEITDYEALTVLNEIKKYDVLSTSLDKLITSLENSSSYANAKVDTTNDTRSNESTNTITQSNNNKSTNSDSSDANNEKGSLALGISALNNKDYPKAMSYFSSIPETATSDFEQSKIYIEQCKKEYKYSLFIEADKLSSEDYYTKAINFLDSYDKTILDNNNKEILDKIDSIKKLREEYLKKVNKSNTTE